MIPAETAIELARKVRHGLIDLQKAISVATSPAAPNASELHVNVCVDFALHWLISNIHLFNAIHPDIKSSIDTRACERSVEGMNFDACIWGGGHWKSEHCSRELSRDTLIVCANKSLSNELPPIGASSLSILPFLRVSCRDGHDWLEAAGLPIIEPSFGRLLDNNSALIQAAIAGLGIILVRKKFARPYLERGDLQ
ncbi:LysR substrate-binding domain-containing protein [Burkholderia sp. FERM BP-3421]|uniref:LysR substrate-binding domain-containing protein n=1 Tax=Burkholderia sp. FERM BP-3421 TaxID=1494466 RepID=UPI00236044B0|nr:LysR substrate-binding domain-containing protein [Burkholderia sp. FERM BP-3421]WDD94047.1 LysR substrate-binding domain-containing protein [Burkholderia sp. FERM BP-3421]